MSAMIQSSKEYAEALFSIAVENSSLDSYLSNLSEAAEIFKENPGYVELLSSPAVELSERLGLIDAAFSKGFEENIVSFLKVLCENGHMHGILDCISEFNGLAEFYLNKTKAKIYYAQALSEEQKAALVEKLEKMSRKSIEPVYIEDRSLLGGIKVEIEDLVLDGSVKKRIKTAKEVINK